VETGLESNQATPLYHYDCQSIAVSSLVEHNVHFDNWQRVMQLRSWILLLLLLLLLVVVVVIDRQLRQHRDGPRVCLCVLRQRWCYRVPLDTPTVVMSLCLLLQSSIRYDTIRYRCD